MKRILTAAVLGASLLASLPASAAEPLVKAKVQASANANAVLDAAQQARCDARKARVQARVQLWGTVHERHQATFANAADRITRVIQIAGDAQVDATKLSADLTAFKAAQAKIEADRKAASDKLNAMLGAACAHSVTDWQGDIKAFQALVTTLHADVDAIKDLYLKTIKPDLMAVAAQVHAKASASADTSAGSGNETNE